VIRMLVKHLLVCVAVAVVVMVGLVAIGWTPRVEYFLALAVATAVASTAVRMINESVEPAIWSDPRPPRVEVAADTRVTFLEHSLRRSGETDSAFALRVRPILLTVARHRLRRAGVDPDEDPAAARQRLGDDAWAVLTGAVDERISHRRLVHTVERIEQL
jgi:hypothetical protein